MSKLTFAKKSKKRPWSIIFLVSLAFWTLQLFFMDKAWMFSNVAHEAEGFSQLWTVFEILEDTLIGYRLPAYCQIKNKGIQTSKILLLWLRSCSCLKEKAALSTSGWNRLTSRGICFTSLRSDQSYSKICDEIFYWQPTEANSALNLILLKKGKLFCAIEVKATHRVRKQDLTGLHAISQLRD